MRPARLNPKRRAQLKALKWSIERNPSSQVETGQVRSTWNDPAKVRRMAEQRFVPDRMRPTGLTKAKSGFKRWGEL